MESDSSIIILDNSPEPAASRKSRENEAIQSGTALTSTAKRSTIRRRERKREEVIEIDLTDQNSDDSTVTRKISTAVSSNRRARAEANAGTVDLENDDEIEIVSMSGRKAAPHRVRTSKKRQRRQRGQDNEDEVAILTENSGGDAKQPADTAASLVASLHRSDWAAPARRSDKNRGNGDNDIQILSVAKKLSPRESAMNQIREIFPDMDPTFLNTKLVQIESETGITSQSIEAVIQAFLISEKDYPKVKKVIPKLQEEKTIDYANDEYEQSIQYKYQANDSLLNSFPFMSKNGVARLLKKYDGRYHKTYMYIVEAVKKMKNYESEVERYDEYTRLMSGGRFKSTEDAEKFKLDLDGIKHSTTLKVPKKNRGTIPITDPILVNEIIFTKKLIRSWGKTVQKERNRLVARKKAEESGATVECTCCYGDYAPMEMIKCYEGHLFCMDCLRRYAEEKVFGNGDLGKKGCTELCCMDMSGCQSFFSREQLLKSLSEKVMKRYDELQTTLVLEKAGLVDDICKCPKCDFQASLPESQNVLQCPACGFESCRKCGEESHIPLRCEEVERKTETSARLQIEEAMTEARIRHCPRGCKQGFYKVEGCNKMTCPTCKTWICYVCRSAIEKNVGYKHFCQTPHCQHKRCNTCPLYSNAEEDDARASREAGLKAAKELKGDSKTESVAEKMEGILNNEELAARGGGANQNAPGRNANALVRARARLDAAQAAQNENFRLMEERVRIMAARNVGYLGQGPRGDRHARRRRR